MRALVCAVVVAISGTAIAQPIAGDPTPSTDTSTTATAHDHAPGAIVGVIGGGVAGATDLEDLAWVARLEVVAFPVFGTKSTNAGAILGFGYGMEYWRAGPDNWGLAIPGGLQVGARMGPAHGVIGFGIHALVVDQIDDDTGVGSWSPYASASLGFRIGKATMVVDGRIDHRFLYGAADRTQWSLGVMFGITDAGAFRYGQNRGPYR